MKRGEGRRLQFRQQLRLAQKARLPRISQRFRKDLDRGRRSKHNMLGAIDLGRPALRDKRRQPPITEERPRGKSAAIFSERTNRKPI